MMIVMKSVFLLLVAAAFLPAATLLDVHTVYIFPMHNALDQYLASELTQQHVFQVVSDPKLADAVFTDRMGPTFEQTFDTRVLDAKPKGEQPHYTTFGGKGGLFLVNKSKQIVWSTLDAPKDTSAKQMAKAARRSVDRLKKDLNPKPARVS